MDDRLIDDARSLIAGDIAEPWAVVPDLEDEIERRRLDMQYVKHLQVIIGSSAKWHLLRSSPEQRAQAFLKTIEAE